MRFACDTGGTFTDLIVEDDHDQLRMYKALTTPDEPARGILNALTLAAEDSGLSLRDFLGQGSAFIHGTTHAINAIITGNTARTAFLTTRGHKDILLFREGGRREPFNHQVPFPDPYVSRSLTFEIGERIDSAGRVRTPIDEDALRKTLLDIANRDVEAIAVCLLWSIVNPEHELAVGRMIEEVLPSVPYTLSHQINPTIREYRRASSTCIDASLKPLMSKYIGRLEERLRSEGFDGKVLILTSGGGVMDAGEVAASPIHVINSGPSMAPIAGAHFSALDADFDDVIVADTGGTTYDVSLVRGGRIPLTRETWIGDPYRGHMTGFPSVDVKSVGAGGGSIAWVDAGGLLHVGPKSAGSQPGPACYGRGGVQATVTDATLVLGYLDPDYFLGGTMPLDLAAAQAAVDRIASDLRLSREEAAVAIIEIATENMVQAIADITINQGIDPGKSALVGGGGAAGLNSVFIARRLGCETLIFPEAGAALSAAGALMSDMMSDFAVTHFSTTEHFDYSGVETALASLERKCRDFAATYGTGALDDRIEFWVEARYRHQVWEIECPLQTSRLSGRRELEQLIEAFHKAHETIFSFRDESSPIEFVVWHATARCRLKDANNLRLATAGASDKGGGTRKCYFAREGWVATPHLSFGAIEAGKTIAGPAIVETPFTTIVIDPPARFERTANGSLVVHP